MDALDVAKLSLNRVVVGPELLDQGAGVLAVPLLCGGVALLHVRVLLHAHPGDEVATALQGWHPAFSEQIVILGLKGLLHLDLLVQSRSIEVVGGVSHHAGPHLWLELGLIISDDELGWLVSLTIQVVLALVDTLAVVFLAVGLDLLQAALHRKRELLGENLVLGLLLSLVVQLLSVQHIKILI